MRNTFILISVLAVSAALLLGINIGRKFGTGQTAPLPSAVNYQPIDLTQGGKLSSPIPSSSGSPLNVKTKSLSCGISFISPANFSLTEASMAAQLTNNNTQESIRLVCTSEIPRPPLTPDKIEDITVAGIKTKLYHDASAKDGTPVDVVIFKHPQNNLDVGLFGFGDNFKEFLNTVNLTSQ